MPASTQVTSTPANRSTRRPVGKTGRSPPGNSISIGAAGNGVPAVVVSPT